MITGPDLIEANIGKCMAQLRIVTELQLRKMLSHKISFVKYEIVVAS